LRKKYYICKLKERFLGMSNYFEMRNKILIITLLVTSFCSGSSLKAQVKKQQISLPDEVMAWTISTMEPWPEGRYKSLKEAMIDNKFFVPEVFHGGLFPKVEYNYCRDSLTLNGFKVPPAFKYENKRLKNFLSYYSFQQGLKDLAYKNVLLKDPRNFRYSMRQLPEKVIKPESIEKPQENVKVEVVNSVPKPEAVDPVIKFIPDRKYWKSTFSLDAKFSQNKSSSNWYGGVFDKMDLYTNLLMTYNYTKDKVSFSNSLVYTLTVNTANNDTLRDYTIGTDRFQYHTILGLKAIKNWDYTVTGDFLTQLCNRYLPNTMNKGAAFLTPYTLTAGLGMTYKANPKFKNKDRSMAMVLTINPLSFKYTNGTDKNISYQYLKSFGSDIEMKNTAKISKSVSLYTRFYYFTNYKQVLCDLENKLDIQISRYFSTTLHLFLRYDDGAKKAEETASYLQWNEMFSIGFKYAW